MRKRIGEFLVEKGVLTSEQVQEVLRYGQKKGMRFGDAALEMNLLNREKLITVFGPNYEVDFFHLEPRYFPEATRRLLTPEEVVRYGALPLGFKTERRLFRARKVLNLGMLNPGDFAHLRAAEHAARSRPGGSGIQGVKAYLVLADQFLEVLRDAYGVDEAAVRAKDPLQMDATLSVFLESFKDGIGRILSERTSPGIRRD